MASFFFSRGRVAVIAVSAVIGAVVGAVIGPIETSFATAPSVKPTVSKLIAKPIATKPVATKTAEATPKKTTLELKLEPQTVSPLDLVKTPEVYLNKAVVMDGTFNSFGTLGLDYKKALRDGNKYLSVIIIRPDVAHHTIPLSELKLFVARKNSEPLMDLETGDDVRIKGTVFSAALGDPWVDVDTITVLHKAHPDKTKEKK
jgi:hypothetical protein